MKRCLVAVWVLLCAGTMWAGNRYSVLDPITHGNLTVWPVVTGDIHDTSRFLTLDEGLRSGEVVVTEASQAAGLIRRRGAPLPTRHTGAEVNRLVLVNNSKRPLLLLAGEIVTGGKQDRVIGKDRIVPPESDPVDLSVFCVEPGRWVGATEKFSGLSAQFAQPSVRANAMAKKDQQKVWDSVNEATVNVQAAAPMVETTTSYARAMDSHANQARLEAVTKPIEDSYSGIIGKLREKKAVGVVVAVGGRIIWADLFASPTLLERYWPKLIRSYAAESLMTASSGREKAATSDAQRFLDDLTGKREVVETEPGVFRHAEISGTDFTVFQLTSLLPNTNFPVHIAKMGDSTVSVGKVTQPVPRPWMRR